MVGRSARVPAAIQHRGDCAREGVGVSAAIAFVGGWVAGWVFLALFNEPNPQHCPACGETLWGEKALDAIGEKP